MCQSVLMFPFMADLRKVAVGRLVERPAIGDQQKIVQRSWMHLAGREKILLVDQPEIILQELILVIHSPVERPDSLPPVLQLLVFKTVCHISPYEEMGIQPCIGSDSRPQTDTFDGV